MINVNSFTVANDSVINCNLIIDSTIAPSVFYVIVYNSIEGDLYLDSSYSVVHTGINEMENALSSLFIYPNPANEVLHISFAPQSSPVTIQLFDLTGRNIKSINTSANNFEIDVSDLNNGIYFCMITGKDFTASRKVIISK